MKVYGMKLGCLWGLTEFKEGVKAPQFKGKLASEQSILDDSLKVYLND